MFHIALHQPQIPQNTGNIIRLAANNGCQLHLIEPLGFDLSEKNLRRCGLDYGDMTQVSLYKNYPDFRAKMAGNLYAFTTKACQFYDQAQYAAADILLFGSETAGLPDEVWQTIPQHHRFKIPMLPHNRSMNLSNAVSIITFEAWRQCKFLHANKN